MQCHSGNNNISYSWLDRKGLVPCNWSTFTVGSENDITCKNRKTQKIVISLCLLRPCWLRVLWCSVCFCTGHFVMVPINLTCPHCLQHSFFEHLLHLYMHIVWIETRKYNLTYLILWLNIIIAMFWRFAEVNMSPFNKAFLSTTCNSVYFVLIETFKYRLNNY